MRISGFRGISRPLFVLISGLTALFVATALGVPAGAAGVTSASVIQKSKAAIAKQSSARVQFGATSTSSTASEKIVGNLGTAQGMETVTDGKAVLSVRVTPTGAYISGTSSGLTSLFRMTAAQAKKLGKRWEYWKAGTSQYSSLKSDVTVQSLLDFLPKAKGTTVTANGSGYQLKWTSAATSTSPALSNTLQLSAAALPVQEVSTDSTGVTATTTVSKWGESVVVHAPPAASTVSSSALKG
jgi:hypothetical protein